MKSIFRILAVLALLSLSQVTTAQGCYPNTRMIPAGAPPSVLTNGTWCPMGSNQQAFNQFGGNPFPVVIGGRRATMVCSWKDRALSGAAGAAIGSLGAYAVNRFTGKNTIDRTGAAVAGGLAGATLLCEPTIWDDGDSVAFVPQQQGFGQQGVHGGGNTINEPSVCAIDGIAPIRGVSHEDCMKIRGRMTTNSPAEVRTIATAPQVQEVQKVGGCGVTLAGVPVKDFPFQAGTPACESAKAPFIQKFLGECNGKSGSVQGDVACGKKL